MKSHYHVLDGLRGTAAFSVFAFHFLEMLVPNLDKNPMPHTFLAVDFFFVLSGFVLGHAYDGRVMAGAGSKQPEGTMYDRPVRAWLSRVLLEHQGGRKPSGVQVPLL